MKTCVEPTTHHHPQPLDNGIHLDSLHSPCEVADVVCHRGLNHDCDQHFPLGHPAWPCEFQACRRRRGWCEWPCAFCFGHPRQNWHSFIVAPPKTQKKRQNAIWHMEIPGESRNPLRWTLKSGDMGVSRPTQPHTDTHTERNAATTRSHVRDDLCSAPAPTPPTPPPRACTSNRGGMEKQSRATRQTNTATDVLSSSIQQPHQRAIQIMQRAVPRRGGARENRWGSKQEQPVFKNSPIRSLISGCCARIRGLRTACGSVCADH